MTEKDWLSYQKRNASIRQNIRAYDEAMSANKIKPRYHFDSDVLDPSDLEINANEIRIKGVAKSIQL
jgi:hypothetical protein